MYNTKHEIVAGTWRASGFLLKDDEQGMHRLGGKPWAGSPICEGCGDEYTLLLTLDLRDPVLSKKWFGCDQIPFIYCPRCEPPEMGLAYQVHPTGNIQILQDDSARSDEWSSEWKRLFPLGQVPLRRCSLTRMSPAVEKLIKCVSAGDTLTRAQEEMIASETGHYADRAVGGYPIINVCNNQVGGVPYLPQGLTAPDCPMCYGDGGGPDMVFLASVTNDRWQGIRVIYDDIYIVYWGCAHCGMILGEQRAE